MEKLKKNQTKFVQEQELKITLTNFKQIKTQLKE